MIGYADHDSTAKFKLYLNFSTIHNGSQSQSPAIIKNKSETESWLSWQHTHKNAQHFSFLSQKMIELNLLECQGHLVS